MTDTYYIADPESPTELARLMEQDRLTTQMLGGLFPAALEINPDSRILDIACGPGGWALEVAQTYPHVEVVGIDVSHAMIEYARAQAQTREADNTNFKVMNVLQKLDFPDASFDLVNARFIVSFIPREQWLPLLQEIGRILKPGGFCCLTESDIGYTTSPALEQIFQWICASMTARSLTFSGSGRTMGIMAVLGKLLKDAGYVDVQRSSHIFDTSYGAELHEGGSQDVIVITRLLKPLVLLTGVTDEQFDATLRQVAIEMADKHFCNVGFCMRAWGEKAL